MSQQPPTVSSVSPDPDPQEQISHRIALLLLMSVAAAAVTGLLTWLAYGNVPAAILAGLPAFGGAYAFFNRHIR